MIRRAMSDGGVIAIIVIIVFVLGCLFFGGCYLHPQYNVWQQGLYGKAELARADWNRQIAIKEAAAKEESAKLLAQAEVERAKGVAEANKIIGTSLHENEDYLRWLWIESLSHTQNQVIYIPTEAGLPILEAGNRNE